MLTLEECEKALRLSEQKARIVWNLEAIPFVTRLRGDGACMPRGRPLHLAADAKPGTGEFFAEDNVISQATIDGIRTLLMADQRERLAEVERQLGQLVVKR